MLGEGISLRLATSDDLERMVEIENECFTELRRFDRKYLETCLTSKLFIVAEIEGAVVGFAVCRADPSEAYLLTLDVHPDFRLLGVAKTLMAATEGTLTTTHVGRVSLHVEVNNSEAITFYKKAGYNIVNHVVRFYRDGADAFEMSKPLS